MLIGVYEQILCHEVLRGSISAFLIDMIGDARSCFDE